MKASFTCLALLTAVAFFPASAAAADKPNFVFLLVDDLGWADVGCNNPNAFYETPNIDALAASGMRFSNGYAAASICSPTRASILTGRHPVRVDITDWIPGNSRTGRFLHVEDRDNLALDEVTIAEQLKDNGYSTFFAGKWHLGEQGHWPTDQGFDINIGGHHKGSPPGGYYAPWKNPVLEAKREGEYLTERLTGESIQFMKQRDEDKPFLLYLSYYNVHTPIQAYRKHIGHFEDKKAQRFPDGSAAAIDEGRNRASSRPQQDNAELASMVSAVDDSVGAIMTALDELKLGDDTVVIFFSDNGGLCTMPAARGVGPGCNLPLRSGKGWLYEGGIREAMIVRAPGVTAAGSVCDVPVMSTDFFPTMLDLAGLEMQPDLHRDGVSLKPLLAGNVDPAFSGRALHWHYPHYHGSGWTPGAAVRMGDWKLIEFWEQDQVELYDLGKDIGEQKDLSQSNPAKVAELQQTMQQWRAGIGAKLPKANPQWQNN